MDNLNSDNHMTQNQPEQLLDAKFIKVYDLHISESKLYVEASRHDIDHLPAFMDMDDVKKDGPDAVSCIVILRVKGSEPKLYLQYEYRYPAGQYLLSVPAGLIDPEDRDTDDMLLSCAKREIKEETGISVEKYGRVYTVNPYLFSTPGFTDESNALVCAVLDMDDLSTLTQSGAVGAEKFNGYRLLSRDDALQIIKKGEDEYGKYYSVYTFMALLYFTSGLWE